MSRNRANKRINQMKSKLRDGEQAYDRTDYLKEAHHQKKAFHLKDLKKVVPLTENQEAFFQAWYDGDRSGYANDVVCGFNSVGVGKSLMACYLGLQAVLDEDSPYEKLIIIRSVVPSRDIGHLPGDAGMKAAVYETPYAQIFDKVFPWSRSYENAKKLGLVQFEVTSFLRGTTFDNCIIVFDEVANATEVEFETVLTRLGRNCRMFLLGDFYGQNDLGSKSGFMKVYNVLKKTKGTAIVEFGPEDIMRSGWVKSYILSKMKQAEKNA